MRQARRMEVHLCLCVLFGVLLFNIFQPGVLANGISTHIEAGERTRHFLDIDSQGVNYAQLIQKHPDAYQAGCPYPDAYYPGICFDGNYHDVAEDTHWVPFLNASIHYIRDTYPRPWNETAEKLVVFLLAIVQHQVADVSWHSLGIEQGYLQTMGKVNYHGSFSAAHNDGDFGGDVVNLYELNMDYIPLVDTWYVPVNDLLGIYEYLYGTADRMLPEVVVECTNWLFLGRLGENLGVIEYLYPEYASRSTFLVDRLNDYFLGGVDDMSVWSANVFRHTVTMLDQGTDVCDLPENAIYIECNGIENQPIKKRPKRDIRDPGANDITRNPGKGPHWLEKPISLVRQDDFTVEGAGEGVVFKTTKSYKKRVLKMLNKRKKNQQKQRNRTKYRHEHGHLADNVTAPDIFYGTNLHYSRLGETLLSGDVNNDGYADLVVAAPGYGSLGNHQRGRVYVVYGSDQGLPATNLTLETDADLILDGPELNGRFGTSVAVVDVNADGYNDLVIGAPSVGSDSLTYYGEVYVYLGTISGLSPSPGITIRCTEQYCNLGWSMTAGDVDHDGRPDVIIGAPFAPYGGEQRGFVGVLFASNGLQGGILTELDFDWWWGGEQDYEWFGYSVTTVNNSPTDGWLIAGAPTYRLCQVPDCMSYDESDVQSVGKLYSFTTPLSGSVTQEVAGNVSLGQLGFTVSGHSQDGQRLLAVAAPTRDFDLDDGSGGPNATAPILQLGYVSVYEGGDLSQEPFFSVVGDREFGRVGASIQFADINGDSRPDVIISAPLRSDTVAEGREEGRAYVFYNLEDKRGKLLMASEADLALSLGENKGRYGYSVAAIQSAAGQQDIAVSAPHSNSGGRLSGLVAVHHL